MSINDFISGFKGGARANRFKVQIAWPGSVRTPNVRDEIVVSGASHPASVMGIIQAPYQGRQIPIPGDRTFEEWTITVLNDKSFSHRNAFEEWSNLINSHEGNAQGTTDLRELYATINVSHLVNDDEVLKTYQIFNAWPSNIAPIELGYDQNDVLSQYSVTFSYSHWQSNTSANT